MKWAEDKLIDIALEKLNTSRPRGQWSTVWNKEVVELLEAEQERLIEAGELTGYREPPTERAVYKKVYGLRSGPSGQPGTPLAAVQAFKLTPTGRRPKE